MKTYNKFYIDGKWVNPIANTSQHEVINPATETAFATIALGGAEDVNAAVIAAKKAFITYSQTSVDYRLTLIKKILSVYQARFDEMAHIISKELGAPLSLSQSAQAVRGLAHIKQAIITLENFQWHHQQSSTTIIKEPLGVIGMITPWNWPINQITCKVAPALAAGCTVVLKPSEITPLNAILFAEILDEAGVPKGVFNLINGYGPTVGEAISAHPDIDMISFTGSTKAGISVAKSAAQTVKRVALELGGKSPNIILDHNDFSNAVKDGVALCFVNSGQSCRAPTRMLVPENRQDEAIAIAQQVAAQTKPGDPLDDTTVIGPVVSEAQYNQIQSLIQQGIDEGAKLIAGGLGKPEGLNTGYYVKPTVFANVSNNMSIAQQEIFGPVLCIIPYSSTADAIQIANDTPYGLFGYISGDNDQATSIAHHIKAGCISINGAAADFNTPFGGYKQSGNGREYGIYGFEEFLEIKAIVNDKTKS
jgi:aldehyde dehydrogenase (NAD+)